MESILMIFAMEDEAIPLVNSLKLSKNNQRFSVYSTTSYSGIYKNLSINLINNGICKRYSVNIIGTQPSAISTHLGIEKFSPDLIINAGTAGGFNLDNAKIGDVYLSYPYVCFHDRRINLPSFERYGIGYYPCLPCKQIAKDLNLRTGVVSTGNSLDFTQKDQEVMQSYKGVVKDMEAASIAWVSELHRIPFLAVKAITDIVDGEIPTEHEFIKNLNKASEILSIQTIRLLDYFSRNSIASNLVV